MIKRKEKRRLENEKNEEKIQLKDWKIKNEERKTIGKFKKEKNEDWKMKKRKKKRRLEDWKIKKEDRKTKEKNMAGMLGKNRKRKENKVKKKKKTNSQVRKFSSLLHPRQRSWGTYFRLLRF